MKSPRARFHSALIVAVIATFAGVPERTAFALPADLAPYFQSPSAAREQADPRRSPLIRPAG